MWFHLGFQNFVAKKTNNDVSCEIFISDFIRIWHKSLSNDELLAISKKLNPLFEAPVEKLKSLTLNLLGDVKVKKQIKEENDNILLKLESNTMNIKFQFDLILSQGDAEMFYKELTLPLLLTLIKIQTTEKKLMEIIKDKDAEIKDYKQNYGITSNYLTTKPFSHKEFFSQEASADIPWDNSFLDCLNSKLCAIKAGPEVKKEKEIPLEEKSESIQSVDKTDKQIFKDKSLNQSSSSSQPLLLLNNKVIKKRKKHNDGFKIKL